VVWTDHADLKYILQNTPVWYKNPVGKLVYACSKLAHHITLVSKSEQRLITEAVGKPLPATYQVIYNGILDTTPPSFERPAADQQAIIFCCTSRLVTAKGIGELITAFKAINTQHNYRLWILGEGPEADAFKQQAADDPAITFWGFPDNSLSILQAADVFVHSSYHEGFSLSIIEAALLRMPIIACAVGGNPEIVIDNQTGLLIPERDSQALAGAMQRMAEDPALRRRLADAARASYEAHFQFDKIVTEQFIPAYEQ
jgi:glycosyltransferase involved in cell wall biosynthesis